MVRCPKCGCHQPPNRKRCHCGFKIREWAESR
jgi:uncharacterized OB-fold protein